MDKSKHSVVVLVGSLVPLVMATICGDKPLVEEPEVHHDSPSLLDKMPADHHIDNPKLE